MNFLRNIFKPRNVKKISDIEISSSVEVQSHKLNMKGYMEMVSFIHSNKEGTFDDCMFGMNEKEIVKSIKMSEVIKEIAYFDNVIDEEN